MYNKKEADRLITLKDVCEKLKTNDTRTAAKWCEKAGIPVVKRRRTRLTYEFLVDIELNKEIVTFLKAKYPNSWEEMLRLYLKNDSEGFILADLKKPSENK